MAPRGPAAAARGNPITQPDETDDSSTTRTSGEGNTNDQRLPTMEEMQRELDEINDQRRAQLATNLEKARAERDAGFPTEPLSMAMPIRAKEVDPLSLDKSFKVSDSKLYTGTNQKDYETLISECRRTFETKPITYATDRAKILYVENFIDETPANDWLRERPTPAQPQINPPIRGNI